MNVPTSHPQKREIPALARLREIRAAQAEADFAPCTTCGSRTFRRTTAGDVCITCDPPALPEGVPPGPICIKCHVPVPPEDLFCPACFGQTRIGRTQATKG